ncbi:MAG: hypothetical protein MI861_26730 [Pirellulales bacterium]|nr:hypothetical protein [Pirellulales bacterium]
MNFLCHAIPYLDQPLLAMATGVPDWLNVVDRRIRARRKLAAAYLNHQDADLRAVAAGIIRHIDDDRWFHGTRAFAETNLQLAVQLRQLLPGDEGFRPTFVGHVLVEIFLDSFWLRDDPQIGERYYSLFEDGIASRIERCVNIITDKPTAKLAETVQRFARARFLFDYLDEDRLLMRLNQIMKRVRLPALPATVGGWLSQAGKLVESRRRQLLTPPDAPSPYPLLPNS